MNDYKDLTWSEIKVMFVEIAKQSKKTDQKFRELKQFFKRVDDQIEKTSQAAEKTSRVAENTSRVVEETSRKVEETTRQIGGILNSNGEVAESYFVNSFKKYPYFAGQNFQFVDSNVRRYSKALNLKDEYDVVLYNGVTVAIIEVKYKVKKEDVEHALKKIETFKALFPQYKNFTFYLGLAGLHINATTEKEAIKQGIAVIKQVGENMIINDAHLKAF